MPLTLSADLEQLIHERIKRGPYQSPEEVIRAGLQLLSDMDDRQRKHLELQYAIQIGIDEAERGELAPLDLSEILDEVEREAGAN